MPKILKNPLFWCLIVFVLIYCGYYSVKWTPNTYYTNTTDEYNRTIEVQQKYYSDTDLVPVLHFRDNKVKSHLSLEGSFILTFIVFIMIIVITRKDDLGKMIEEYKMKNFVKEYIKSFKPEDMKLIAMFPQTPIRREKVDYNKSVPLIRDVITQVELGESFGDMAGEQYLAFRLNPFEEFIEEIIWLTDIPNSQMKCPNCGGDFDFKETTAEGFQEFRQKWGLQHQR